MDTTKQELCGTVGCTYCDPANYDGWDDEDCARQQVEADAKQCITAIRDEMADMSPAVKEAAVKVAMERGNYES